MHAVGWDARQFDAAGLCQRQEAVVVLLPQCQTALVDAFRHFQLAPQVSGLQVRHQIAGTDVAPGIFIDLATEELAAVGAFLADDFRPIDQGRIVHQRRAAFAAGGVVFGFMEAEAADMANGAQCLAFVGRHHTLRGVFHHEQVIFLRQRHDGIHLAGNAGIVHWHNRAGFIGDRRFDFGFVDVHGVRTQVDEHHFGTAQHKGVGG